MGLKVQQLRKEQGLSYQQLSDKTGLAISYLHNIEKGKRYPKADKILLLAKAFDVDYNYLVSVDSNKKLQPVIDLLTSDLLQLFPLETFGISPQKVIELLSETPDKVNAFISTVIKIVRNYDMQGEDFYKIALRSYQDMHDNYLTDLEKAAQQFRKEHPSLPIKITGPDTIEQILFSEYGISIDRTYLKSKPELRSIRSHYVPELKKLYLNTNLDRAQETNVLAMELGFQYLKVEERPFTIRMIDVDSFEKLLNNYRAAYFAAALQLDEGEMINIIHQMSKWSKWDPEQFCALLSEFNVTSEVLLQRLANIFPHHFGIENIFFLRFYTGPRPGKFEMTKEMHLSQLHNPHANQLDEHYCRRWVSLTSINDVRAAIKQNPTDSPTIAEAQVSHYYADKRSYFCIALAKQSHDVPENTTSVTIGLLMTEKLKKLFPFLNDSSVKRQNVHTTCERCAIKDCGERVIAPVHLDLKERQEEIKGILEELKEVKEEVV